jgi:hypothetical protein
MTAIASDILRFGDEFALVRYATSILEPFYRSPPLLSKKWHGEK